MRIEDTDRTRSTKESEQAIFDALRWMGLQWDEGPDTGGDAGPYRQSERNAIYREYCEKLVLAGKAYPCFCTQERLEELRKKQQDEKSGKQGYDGLCASLSREEAARRVAAGEPHVIRMLVPESGECVFKDRFREEVRIPWNTIDHQVLLKSDGYPTYHLANVVDDHLMEITEVIRGEEWISSTPKHLLLYQAFGWDPPEFAHLPLLRNPDKSKLSKRKNPTGILYYRRAGILPEALLNYLGLIAYSMVDGRERFSLEELVADFDIDRISLGGPVFDIQKLTSFNGDYIRALNPEQLLERLKKWMLNDETWLKIIPLARPRLNTLSDLVPMSAYLFADKTFTDPELPESLTKDGNKIAELLKIAQWKLESLAQWDSEAVKACFNVIAEKENIKLKELMMPFYIVISGSKVSLPVFESMEIIGKDMCIRRLQYALEAMENAGFALKGKTLKKLADYYEKQYNRQ